MRSATGGEERVSKGRLSAAWSGVSQTSPRFEIPVQMYHDTVLKAEVKENSGNIQGLHWGTLI